MKSSIARPATAAFLSFLLPGVGQAAGGRPRQGAIIVVPALALAAAFAVMFVFAQKPLTNGLNNSEWLTSLLVVDIVACFYHLWAVVDAYVGADKAASVGPFGRRALPVHRPSASGIPILIVLLIATVGLHVSLGIVIRGVSNGISCGSQGSAPCATATNVAEASLPEGAASPSATIATPSASAAPQASGIAAWVANAASVQVRSGPGTNFAATGKIARGKVITGQVVTGGSYTVQGTTSTDWIKIDVGQPLAGGYVAKAFFDATTIAPSAPPSPSASPT